MPAAPRVASPRAALSACTLRLCSHLSFRRNPYHRACTLRLCSHLSFRRNPYHHARRPRRAAHRLCSHLSFRRNPYHHARRPRRATHETVRIPSLRCGMTNVEGPVERPREYPRVRHPPLAPSVCVPTCHSEGIRTITPGARAERPTRLYGFLRCAAE